MCDEIFWPQVFCDVALETGGERVLPVFSPRVGGKGHRRRRRDRRILVSAELAQERVAVFFRHSDVAHHDVRRV